MQGSASYTEMLVMRPPMDAGPMQRHWSSLTQWLSSTPSGVAGGGGARLVFLRSSSFLFKTSICFCSSSICLSREGVCARASPPVTKTTTVTSSDRIGDRWRALTVEPLSGTKKRGTASLNGARGVAESVADACTNGKFKRKASRPSPSRCPNLGSSQDSRHEPNFPPYFAEVSSLAPGEVVIKRHPCSIQETPIRIPVR